MNNNQLQNSPVELVKKEHFDSVGGFDDVKIRSIGNERYYCYWNDGWIERRDLYVVDFGGAILEESFQRYRGDYKWHVVR